MAFSRISLRPGVNTELTETDNQAGISDSQLIRFRQGRPEKLGGWLRFTGTSMGSVTRALHGWQDLDNNKWLAAGSLLSLNAIQGGNVTDITPHELTTNPTRNFSVSVGSKIVTIIDNDLADDLWQYDAVHFNTPVSVGGIILTGFYQVRTGAAGTTYTVESLTTATSTVVNAGTVPAFASTAGDASVVVTLADHGLVDGDSFTFPIATMVGGITITGTYQVSQVTTTNAFTILTPTVASATAVATMNGGDAQLHYYLTEGPATSATFGGLGAIGEFAIGEGQLITSTVTHQLGTPIVATDWTLANWGEFLVANPKGGPLFYWPPRSGFLQAIPIGAAPPFNNGMFVAMPQQMLVAYGTAASMTEPGRRSELDPMMIRWSHVADFFTWRATSGNQAGSFRLPIGSEIRGAIPGASQSFIFTDIGTWAMQYVRPPLVFGFTQIASGAGLLGPHAVCALHGIIYYMGPTNFFRVGSSSSNVQPIPCTVWDTVYADLDTGNAHKACAAANGLFNEVFFFYPSLSGGTGENDKYVKYCVLEGTWDVGTLPRSAWTDVSVIPKPIGAELGTYLLQQHETGTDADTVAMNSWFETGNFALGEGEDFAFVDEIQPDMVWSRAGSVPGSVDITITTQTYPNSGDHMADTLTMTSTVPFLTPRVRGRQGRWRLESTDAGTFWRMGHIRFRVASDGRRG